MNDVSLPRTKSLSALSLSQRTPRPFGGRGWRSPLAGEPGEGVPTGYSRSRCAVRRLPRRGNNSVLPHMNLGAASLELHFDFVHQLVDEVNAPPMFGEDVLGMNGARK